MEEKDNKDVLTDEERNNANDYERENDEQDEENGAAQEQIIVEDIEIIDEQVTEEEIENAEELRNEVAQLKEENEQLIDRMKRLQAEYENYKRRTQKERAAERKYESESLALEILPVLDNFERALKTEVSEENKGFFDGMKMIYQQLNDALKSQGIEPIESKDKEFDPNYHHAVMQTEEEGIASNIIVEELQKGYMLKDKVIRAAMVKVNK